MRSKERKIEEYMIKKCLKYGIKSLTKDGKTQFELGDLHIIKVNASKASAIVTAWKVFDGIDVDVL